MDVDCFHHQMSAWILLRVAGSNLTGHFAPYNPSCTKNDPSCTKNVLYIGIFWRAVVLIACDWQRSLGSMHADNWIKVCPPAATCTLWWYQVLWCALRFGENSSLNEKITHWHRLSCLSTAAYWAFAVAITEQASQCIQRNVILLGNWPWCSAIVTKESLP